MEMICPYLPCSVLQKDEYRKNCMKRDSLEFLILKPMAVWTNFEI